MLRAYLSAGGSWLVPVAVASMTLGGWGVVRLVRGRPGGLFRVWAGLWIAMVGISIVPAPSSSVDRHCSLELLLPAPHMLVRLTEEAVNFWPYVVLGALSLLVISGSRLVAIVALTPLAIEFAQFMVPALGRNCSVADLALNLSAVILGAILGWLLRAGLEVLIKEG